MPPGTIVNVEPGRYCSLPPTFVVTPVVPPGGVDVSSIASSNTAAAVVTLLAVLVSFVAPVVPVNVTVVVASSLPPGVPGT